MTTQPLELGRRLVPEREHRGLGVTVLPLEPREHVEALVDRFEPTGRHHDTLPQRADRGQRVLDEGAGAIH